MGQVRPGFNIGFKPPLASSPVSVTIPFVIVGTGVVICGSFDLLKASILQLLNTFFTSKSWRRLCSIFLFPCATVPSTLEVRICPSCPRSGVEVTCRARRSFLLSLPPCTFTLRCGFPVIVSEKSPPQAIAGTDGNQGEICGPPDDATFGKGLFTIGLIISWALAERKIELTFVDIIPKVPEVRRKNSSSTRPDLDQI